MEQTDSPEQIALDEAIERAGGKTSLMRKLNELGHDIKSHNTITQWREAGAAPSKYCRGIEELTGVSRSRLRSDWQLYWPELAEKV